MYWLKGFVNIDAYLYIIGDGNLNVFLDDKIKFGKGSISQQCGWICDVLFGDGSNDGKVIYFDFEHSICELHERRK